MTSSEIAKLAGVSRSTVSRVLNNYDDISFQTRQKVLAVIKEYDYVPNSFGRGLTGKLPRVIGLFIVDMDNNSDDTLIISRSEVFYRFTAFIADIAHNLNYKILISIIEKRNASEIQRLFEDKSICAGVIIGDTIDDSIIRYLGEHKFIVSLHNQCDSTPYPNIITVNADNVNFAYKATCMLLQKGHTEIGLITGNFRKYTVQKRMAGFQKALEEYHIPFNSHCVGIGDFHRESGGYDAVNSLIGNYGRLPSALVVSNSVMLPGVVERLNELHVSIPDDISVVGVGSFHPATLSNPAITDLHIDSQMIASAMISKTTQLLDIGTVKSNTVILDEYELFEHNSIRDIRGE